ncbi:MAG: SDR family oxidoreductase [Victivallales bacterium]|nr:SDR family oxidoreductase [Victivallales bacterium]
MEIADRTVLITGGALRIGQALTQSFAAAGARVIIHCRHAVAAAATLRDRLPNPDRHRIIQADLADAAAVAALLPRCGKVDMLINNAAMFVTAPLQQESDRDMQRQLQVNFLAPLELMRQFARQEELTQGVIINILDQQIVRHPNDTGSYLLAKQSLAEATLLAARQFAPTIRVNALAPGPVLPPSHLPPGAGMKKVLAQVPLRRQVELGQLTEACLFLCRNEAVTGQILFVDGGQHLT